MGQYFFLLVIAEIVSGQEFKILANNTGLRAAVTDTIQLGDFVLGVNQHGGGYITRIVVPGRGEIMGIQAQRYGRGGQSSIRDMVRKGQYNPTQAGFSDDAGTEYKVVKSTGKLVVSARGCALYNGDGGFDYVRWENIKNDPYIQDNGNSDLDNIYEENLTRSVNGEIIEKQEAEVYSDFDFYCEYENLKGKAGLYISMLSFSNVFNALSVNVWNVF